MVEVSGELIIEILRRIQADIADLKLDNREIKGRLGNLELKSAQIEIRLADMSVGLAEISVRMDRRDETIERIMRRLELVEPPR